MIHTLKMAGVTSVFALALLASPVFAADQTIVEIAVGDENFSTLVDLVVAAELDGVLSGTDPYTVFAPTNDAFAKLPGFVNKALESNPDLLTDILLYHVVPGTILAEDVLAEESLTTAQGGDVHIRTAGPNAFVNFSRITATDIEASNGVIHVIDRVLIPRSVYAEAIKGMRQQLDRLRDTVAEQQRMRGHHGMPAVARPIR